MTDKYTDEELEMLSEEERAALKEEEDETPPPPAEDEAGEEETKEEDTPAEEEPPPPPEEPAEPPPQQPEQPQQSQHQQPFVPQLKAELDVDAVKKQLAELKERYADGDVDPDDYEEQRDALRDQIKDYERATSYNQQMQEQLWQYEQDLFFKENPEYRENVAKRGALKEAFAMLDADEANQGKTGLDLLKEARAMVEEQLGPGQQQVSPEPPPQKREVRKPEMEKAPPPQTLAHTPPAAENDVGRDEFAHLDRLQGPELEEALAKMTPEQERKYLRMGG